MRKAAGFVIFRRWSSQIEYLLLKASYGIKHWSFPKGHCDPGENELETAHRETEEEAGFSKGSLKVYTDGKFTLRYRVDDQPKEVVYWVAELTDPITPVRLSEEHTEYKWAMLEEAKVLAQYEDFQDLLIKSENFIKNVA